VTLAEKLQFGAELLHLLAFSRGFVDRIRLVGDPRRLGELLRHHLLDAAEHAGKAVGVGKPVRKHTEEYALDHLFLKCNPVSVHCHGRVFLNNGIHDLCSITIQFENGSNAVINASWLHP
jgi:hypothetical protein